MGILSWIIFGLIAGALAKLIMPGNQGMGWLMTIILGIVGAMVGGWLGSMIFGVDVTGFNISSFLVAIGGALLVLFIFGAVTKGRN